MADSPKCLACLKRGRIGQTYKIARTSKYMCHDCRLIYEASSFKQEEFKWKDNAPEWENFIKSQGFELSGDKVVYVGEPSDNARKESAVSEMIELRNEELEKEKVFTNPILEPIIVKEEVKLDDVKNDDLLLQ